MRPAYAIAAVLAAVLALAAQSPAADGFQRGDLLASVGDVNVGGSGVIARFAAHGTPKGELANSTGAGPLCFDASGHTGVLVTCPAAGPKCRADVTLSVAGTGARAAAASVTRVGTLMTMIAPGAKARLVVRVNQKGGALIRRRRDVTIAARVSIRAGSGPALIRQTYVRVHPRRPGKGRERASVRTRSSGKPASGAIASPVNRASPRPSGCVRRVADSLRR